MTWLWILAGIHSVMWITLLGNLLYLRRSGAPSRRHDLPFLSVIVPARNELDNLSRLLPSLEMQDYPHMEVIIFDDASTDGTRRLLESYGGTLRLKVLSGSGPPPGWVGKVHALYQGSLAATGDVLLFLDADVELTAAGSLQTLVSKLLDVPGTALTVLPRLSGGGLTLVSLVPHTILTGLPWPLVGLLRRRSIGAINGQAWMISTIDYKRLDPHRHVKGEILEDVQIGRYLLASGVVPRIVPAAHLITVHMYDDFADAWRGFRKNAYLLMGGRVLPFVLLLIIFAGTNWMCILVSKYLFISAVLLKIVTDRVGRIPAYVSLFAPASLALASVLQLDSAIAHWRGTVEWKGRRIPRPA